MPLAEDGQVYRSLPSVLKNAPFWRGMKLRRCERLAAAAVDLAGSFENESDEYVRERGARLRDRAINGESLDVLLVECFAVVREASRRLLGMAHYPVQLMGGAALHFGHIIEMATGEGKTLCATLPAALNALSDRGVHVVTVNDYLARRDAEEMGPVYRFLGLSVGVVQHDSLPPVRRAAYRESITYVTNKEIGFDGLRDELAGKNEPWFSFGKRLDELASRTVHRPVLHFAIVDEADSILIDEARTPLILSNRPPISPESAREFRLADEAVAEFVEQADFTYDRKEKNWNGCDRAKIKWCVCWATAEEHAVNALIGMKRVCVP